MSGEFDQLARMVADSVVRLLRESGRVAPTGGSWLGGEQAGAQPGAAVPHAGGRAGKAGGGGGGSSAKNGADAGAQGAGGAGPIAPGLYAGNLWHAQAPRTFSDERVARGEVPIGISARHCHVTQEALEVLFGKGAALTLFKPLMQQFEFAANERVTVRSVDERGQARGEIAGVRILGPTRNLVQVEVAQTDLRALGMSAPVRPSGTHDGSSGAVLVGPAGTWTMPRGVIRANRHIHLSPRNAADLKLKENDIVAVHVPGPKPLTCYDVQIRVRDTFHAQFHLDTDDGNAADVRDGDVAHIIEKVRSA